MLASLGSKGKNRNSLACLRNAGFHSAVTSVLYFRAGLITCLAPSKLPLSRQPGSGAGAAEAATALLASEAVPSEDAGFLSHVHTDRPLGRPREPLLQQHVGLLVVQRTAQAAALLDFVLRQ